MLMDSVLARYRAPWGTMLKVTTGLSTVLLLGIAIAGLFLPPKIALAGQPWPLLWIFLMTAMPLTVLLGSALFTIRGYILTPLCLHIQRLGWQTKINLQALVSAEANSNAMSQSWRLFGNGGLFAFAGWFRNQQLGNYRAYATDLKRCVVIKLADRVIVVTPDRPHDLVEQLNLLAQR